MHPSANDGQPAPAATEGGHAHSEGPAGRTPSRWRRRPGLTALVVVGLVVAAAGAVGWFGVTRAGPAEPPIGAGVKPPPCAEPGTGDLVEPERGSAFRFT